MRAFEQELRPLGLGMAYLPVVRALQESGPLTQKDLTVIARVEQPTMAALLVRMERDGIIARHKSATDRRSADIVLTEAGRQALTDAQVRLGRIVDRALAGFDGDDSGRLMALLQRMVANLDGGGAAALGLGRLGLGQAWAEAGSRGQRSPLRESRPTGLIAIAARWMQEAIRLN